METSVSAHRMGLAWVVTCSVCGVLAMVDEEHVDRYCNRHMGEHDLVAA